jgi:hypothetical protein
MHRIFNIPLFCRKSENIRTKPKKNIGNPRFFIEHGKHKFFLPRVDFLCGIRYNGRASSENPAENRMGFEFSLPFRPAWRSSARLFSGKVQ